MRINFKNGYTEAVPVKQLQNKANRYYFKDTLEIGKGVEGCVHNSTSEQQLMEERARYLESLEAVVEKRTLELQKEIAEHQQTVVDAFVKSHGMAKLREKATLLDNIS